MVEDATAQIKEKVAAITIPESGGIALNRIEVLGTPMNTTITFKIKFRVSIGTLYSVGDLTKFPNISTTYFTSSVPWVSKQSYPGTATQFTTQSGDAYVKYYTELIYGITGTPTSTEMTNTWNTLPTGRAAHHMLSNKNVFWPNPLAQLSGWYPAYSATIRAVATPIDIKVSGAYVFPEVKVSENSGPLAQIIAVDVPDCSNPYAPPVGITPNQASMSPSKLLGWFDSEFHYSLSSIRNIPAAGMNYFWGKKPDLVIVAQGRAASTITAKMAKLKSGFYTLTNLDINPNIALSGNCTYPCADLCLHKADYRVHTFFNHYTLLPATPSQLATYF